MIGEPDIPWPARHDRTCPERCWRCQSIQDSARVIDDVELREINVVLDPLPGQGEICD